MRKSLCFSALLLFALSWSCKHDQQEVPIMPVPEVPVCFSEDVLPIFQTNCAKAGCHNSATASGGHILDSYENIVADGIEPFKPEDSDIFEVITETDPAKKMPKPPNIPLSAAEVNTIRLWIRQGAKNTTCPGMCDTVDVKYSDQVTAVLNKHCMSCHTGPASSSGYDLQGYDNLKIYADNGWLHKSINHIGPFVPMPYMQPKMAPCKIRMIDIWIENGAPNN